MWIPALYLLLVQPCLAERDLAPVFVIDYEKVLSHITVEPNPFVKMKSSEFSILIDEAIKQAKVIILFVEESFCIEDVTLKDKSGSPFFYLGQALREKRVTFLPSVSQPFKTLKRHLQPLASYTFHLSDSSSIQIYDKNLRHFYIYFKDKTNETRSAALRRHDLLIKEVYYVVRQIAVGPVVAFYTGKMNPIVVEKMKLIDPVKTQKTYQPPAVTIYSTGALFKFVGVYGTIGKRRSMFSQIPLIAEETWEKHGLTTRMAYTDFELEFFFEFKDDRWTIDNVALLEWGEEVGRTDVRVGAPWDWSYMCSDPLVLINMRDGSAVTITHYQIQAFNFNQPQFRRQGNATESPRCFGPVVSCGPYFNAQILAGLMVTFMCLGILVYGIVSLYGINSNSRYDDAQGKPLVIVMEGGGR